MGPRRGRSRQEARAACARDGRLTDQPFFPAKSRASTPPDGWRANHLPRRHRRRAASAEQLRRQLPRIDRPIHPRPTRRRVRPAPIRPAVRQRRCPAFRHRGHTVHRPQQGAGNRRIRVGIAAAHDRTHDPLLPRRRPKQLPQGVVQGAEDPTGLLRIRGRRSCGRLRDDVDQRGVDVARGCLRENEVVERGGVGPVAMACAIAIA